MFLWDEGDKVKPPEYSKEEKKLDKKINSEVIYFLILGIMGFTALFLTGVL